MPTIDPKKAADAAETAAARKARREARHGTSGNSFPGNGTGTAKASDEDEIVPMPNAKMLNLPETVTVGDLSLVLVCPKIGKAMRLQEQIFTAWPDILLFAATGDMEGEGISPAAVQMMWDAGRRQGYEVMRADAEARGVDMSTQPAYEPLTPGDVRAAMSRLAMSLDDALPGICDTVWQVAAGSPGLSWPATAEDPEGNRAASPPGCQWLDDAIREGCSLPELADLLRALLGCMGGFQNDVAARFPAGDTDGG